MFRFIKILKGVSVMGRRISIIFCVLSVSLAFTILAETTNLESSAYQDFFPNAQCPVVSAESVEMIEKLNGIYSEALEEAGCQEAVDTVKKESGDLYCKSSYVVKAVQLSRKQGRTLTVKEASLVQNYSREIIQAVRKSLTNVARRCPKSDGVRKDVERILTDTASSVVAAVGMAVGPYGTYLNIGFGVLSGLFSTMDFDESGGYQFGTDSEGRAAARSYMSRLCVYTGFRREIARMIFYDDDYIESMQMALRSLQERNDALKERVPNITLKGGEGGEGGGQNSVATTPTKGPSPPSKKSTPLPRCGGSSGGDKTVMALLSSGVLSAVPGVTGSASLLALDDVNPEIKNFIERTDAFDAEEWIKGEIDAFEDEKKALESQNVGTAYVVDLIDQIDTFLIYGEAPYFFDYLVEEINEAYEGATSNIISYQRFLKREFSYYRTKWPYLLHSPPDSKRLLFFLTSYRQYPVVGGFFSWLWSGLLDFEKMDKSYLTFKKYHDFLLDYADYFTFIKFGEKSGAHTIRRKAQFLANLGGLYEQSFLKFNIVKNFINETEIFCDFLKKLTLAEPLQKCALGINSMLLSIFIKERLQTFPS